MSRSIRYWLGVVVWSATFACVPSMVRAAFVEVGACDALSAARAASHVRLIADVDCSTEEAALLLSPAGRLELRSHTLRGVEVLCLGDCRVFGPGTIENGGVAGGGHVVVRRVTVSGSPGDGVVASNPAGSGRVTLIDSTIADSFGTGVEFDRRASFQRSHVVRSGRHGVAVSMRAGNDCARGRIAAKASTFQDNGRDGDCGSAEVCADLATCTAREAQLRYSTCDHSRQLGSGLPGSACGVCDFD
ncbi:MAG: hypothetical protein ABIR79_10530 [Candidatus Binatia bacterium]